MSIANYSDLQTATASWLHRSDLTSIIPDFITLAENRIHYGSENQNLPSPPLRIRAMHNRSTGTISSATIAIPTGYLETIRLVATINGLNRTLVYLPPMVIAPFETDSGDPSYYTLINNDIHTAPNGSASYTHDYYKKLDALSAGVNWLITNAPHVYLFATLLESASYILNDGRIAVWHSQYLAAISGLSGSDARQAMPSGGLAVSVA